jgi:hypothetical protein
MQVEVKCLLVAQRTRLTKRRGQSAGPDPWPSLILWTDRPNRRLKFKKRGELFIRAHTKRFPSPSSQDRARIVFDCRTVNDPAMMSSTIPPHVCLIKGN